jgi:teichuronic acid biosynthesis glycosyltransferase TuaC
MAPAMRIAIVTTSFPSSEGDPAGHFVRTSARELERRGHEIAIIAPPAGGAFGWPGFAARVRERPYRALEAAAWVVRARARASHIDVQRVIAHWAVPCAWPIGTASRAPLEVISHGGDVRLLARLPARARARIVHVIASRAVGWSFASEALMRDLLVSLDRPTRSVVERVAVVRAPALEIPDVRDAVARVRRDLGTTRIAVVVGRLIATKHVDRAIEHVARTRDVDALVVVGDGPERVRLERLARARRVDARFVGILGRDEALAWIGAADALIHASTAEGLSSVVREAEALGTRVVPL